MQTGFLPMHSHFTFVWSMLLQSLVSAAIDGTASRIEWSHKLTDAFGHCGLVPIVDVNFAVT